MCTHTYTYRLGKRKWSGWRQRCGTSRFVTTCTVFLNLYRLWKRSRSIQRQYRTDETWQ